MRHTFFFSRSFRWLLIPAAFCGCVPGAFAQLPLLYNRSVFNAASYTPGGLPAGAIAQGSVFTVFGANLGPAKAMTASSFPLGTHARQCCYQRRSRIHHRQCDSSVCERVPDQCHHALQRSAGRGFASSNLQSRAQQLFAGSDHHHRVWHFHRTWNGLRTRHLAEFRERGQSTHQRAQDHRPAWANHHVVGYWIGTSPLSR